MKRFAAKLPFALHTFVYCIMSLPFIWCVFAVRQYLCNNMLQRFVPVIFNRDRTFELNVSPKSSTNRLGFARVRHFCGGPGYG